MKKHRLLLTLISVFVLISVCITAFAIVGAKKPDSSAGKTENLIADRISVSLENTDFTIKKTDGTSEEYTLTMFLTVAKTQGDFYALINNLRLSGISYSSMTFTALTPASQGKTLDKLTLTANDGVPDTYKWQLDVTLPLSAKGVFTPELIIDYTSGTKEADAQQKLMRIPLTITVK